MISRLFRRLGRFWGLMAYLAIVSAMFTYDVERFKAETKRARAAASVDSGTRVQIVEVVDACQILVRHPDGRELTIRLLGVSSFDPALNEPGAGAIGRSFVTSLTQALRGGVAVLEFGEQRRDRKGRLLAHLTVDGHDVAPALIQQGLCFVGTTVPFAREDAYLKVEREAKLAGTGLWGHPEAAQRAEYMKALWEAVRKDA
ncbi:MAG: thermonuclease family protein [Candidatus Riflebacteria bacterium]|nr:thermonuclease family protein [Candidatus Riflebacteria bacterium]